jgi:hypothetical protein
MGRVVGEYEIPNSMGPQGKEKFLPGDKFWSLRKRARNKNGGKNGSDEEGSRAEGVNESLYYSAAMRNRSLKKLTAK